MYFFKLFIESTSQCLRFQNKIRQNILKTVSNVFHDQREHNFENVSNSV